MGAQAFVHTIKAKTASEGFNRLVDEALHMYGHEPYNGTISTCSLGRCTKRYASATKKNIVDAEKFVEDNDYGEKWEARYIDLGPSRKGAKTDHTYMFYGWASC